MSDKKFVGMLVLDVSVDTNTKKIIHLIQTVASVFDHTRVLDLINSTPIDVDRIESRNILGGLCLLASDSPAGELFVPAKNSSVTSWLSGTVVNPEDVHSIFSKTPTDQDDMPDIMPSKLMLRLNSDQHEPGDFPNYAHRVKARFTDFMRGKWSSMAVFSGGNRSTVVLAKRGKELYFSFVHVDQCSLLFWSTEPDFLMRLFEAIPDDIEQSFLKHECFVNHITPLNDKSTLILHPIFLLTKYRTWGERANFNQMRLFTVFSSYLERLAV